MTAVAVPELQPCLCLVRLGLPIRPSSHIPHSNPSRLGGFEGMSSAWYGLSDLLLVEREIDDKFSWPANNSMQTRRGVVSYGCAA